MYSEREVENMGYTFTGMTAEMHDKTKLEYNKQKAMRIKKANPGADYKIVAHICESRWGKEPWRRVYGNKVFMQALNEEFRKIF